MQLRVSLQEMERIVVGEPIPFSVFSADGHLLLAAGRVVESEKVRQKLLSHGTARKKVADPEPSREEPAPVVLNPLAVLRQSYRAASVGRRFALTMAPDEKSEAFRTSVIGVRDSFIVVDAPVRANGSLAAAAAGQVWLCRTLQVTSAFKFSATVLKVAFEPFPHLHLLPTPKIARRKIRDRIRVSVLIDAAIQAPVSAACIMVDLNVGGGRIATQDDVLLEREQQLKIAMRLELLEQKFDLLLNAVVVGTFGASEGEHPRVVFYGIKFESLSQLESLVLHGFVNSHLALELNCLWHVLSAASPE
jgi:hypothetical protein